MGKPVAGHRTHVLLQSLFLPAVVFLNSENVHSLSLYKHRYVKTPTPQRFYLYLHSRYLGYLSCGTQQCSLPVRLRITYDSFNPVWNGNMICNLLPEAHYDLCLYHYQLYSSFERVMLHPDFYFCVSLVNLFLSTIHLSCVLPLAC